jgi:CubicO group peptidase (beta-lactamase class C family)
LNHHSVWCFAIGVLVVAAMPVPGADLSASVDACVQTAMASHDIPGLAVAVVVDGEIAYERGYGVTHRQQGGAVDEHTLFRFGSVGKMMTGAAVMRLVDGGVVDLDDPVTEYVPELHFAPGPWTADQMTVRHLITNAAGIPSFRTLPQGTLSEWAETLDEVTLLAKPGAFYNYSNSNFALADLVVERASGMEFNDYVELELFLPAGMSDSTKNPSAAVDSGNYSFGHADDGTVYAPDDYTSISEGFTSAHDLALWGRMMLSSGGEVLSPSACDAAQARQISTFHNPGRPTSIDGGHYGFGIFVDDFPSGTIRHHGGGIPGWVARIAWVRSEGFAVAMLANSWPNAFGGVSEAVECILESELGVTMPDMSVPSDPATWHGFPGVYDAVYDDGYRFEVVIERSGDDLLMTAPNPSNPDQLITRTLENLHHGSFRFWESSASWWDVSFISDPGNPEPVRWLRNMRFVGLRQGVRGASARRVTP